MKIGIIGAGQIGGTLVRRFRATGQDVSVANSRGPDTLTVLATETGAHAVELSGIISNSEVVVLAIPTNRITGLPGDLFANAAPGLVVVDTSNYYPQQRDGLIAGIEESDTESGWVERQIGHPVVKAFNTIIAEHLLNGGKPAGTAGHIALAIAGDDRDAKATTISLVDQIGFDAIDAGGIADSWRQQPGTPGYIADGNVAAVLRTLAAAVPGRSSEWRATAASPGNYQEAK